MLLAGKAQAQTVRLDPIVNTTSNFTYGNLSFSISNCNFIYMGATTSCSSDNSEIEAVSTGRGGTEIEIVSAAGPQSQTAGEANTSLSFGLTVSDLPGAGGLSSITNKLSAAVNHSADDPLVSSVLSGFNVTASPGTVSSNAGALTTNTSFALTRSPVSFNVALNLDSAGAKKGDTLTLSNVEFVFTPAPEPASVAVLLIGLGGIVAARRRAVRRSPT